MGAEDNPWLTHSKRLIYENPWIELSEAQVTTPAGTPGLYGRLHFRNVAVGVVPVDDEGYTWLVGQYRYVTDSYSWEIPEGGAPSGEDPLEAAKRELKEETGLIAERWELLVPQLYLSNSVSDEVGLSYIARGLEMGQSDPEDTEELQLKRLPLGEAIEMALDGRIQDALSVISLLHCQKKHDGKD